jgi:hypothetical protein
VVVHLREADVLVRQVPQLAHGVIDRRPPLGDGAQQVTQLPLFDASLRSQLRTAYQRANSPQRSNLDSEGGRFQTALTPTDHLDVRARTQLIAAVAAGVFGIAGLAFALFTPLHAYQDCFAMAGTDGQQLVCRGSMQSMFDESGLAAFAGMLVPAYFFAVVGVSGAKNARAASRQTRRLLWLSTAVLVSLTFVMIFSIGPFMLPGTLLALYASLLSRNADAAAAGGRTQPKAASAAG